MDASSGSVRIAASPTTVTIGRRKRLSRSSSDTRRCYPPASDAGAKQRPARVPRLALLQVFEQLIEAHRGERLRGPGEVDGGGRGCFSGSKREPGRPDAGRAHSDRCLAAHECQQDALSVGNSEATLFRAPLDDSCASSKGPRC
jgi:hypothetical protein